MFVFLSVPANADEACTLLRPEDAESVLGAKVKPSIARTDAAGGMLSKQCRYITAQKPVGYVDLSSADYDSDDLFNAIHGDDHNQPTNEPVEGIGDRAFYHTDADSLSVYVGRSVYTLQIFRQQPKATRDDHVTLMRTLMGRR